MNHPMMSAGSSVNVSPALAAQAVSGLVQYDPSNLLDALIEHLSLKNDAALARALETAPPIISKIRNGKLPVGGSMLIRMHEISRLSISELRALMGDRRSKFRISDKQGKPKDGADMD